MLFKLARGFLLHPSVALEPGAKIADIGAGTCIWPVELLQELDHAVSVDAIDVSMAQCPPEDWLPKDINLITHDVYKPFPSHMLGSYDLVHVQNWLCIWSNETSDGLVRNLLALLKPGGFLQWSEQDPASNRIIVAPNCKTSQGGTEEVLNFLSNPRQTISFEWVSQLGDFLGQRSELVAFDRYTAMKEHQMLWNIGVLQACEEFGTNLKRNAKTEDDTKKVADLEVAAEKAAVEMLNGVGIYSELVVAVAQKAS